MISPQEIERRIADALPGARIQVDDLTGGGDHYRVIVVASQFADQGALDRHRTVYAIFKDVLGGELHALSLETTTPEEWKSQQESRQSSPGSLPRL